MLTKFGDISPRTAAYAATRLLNRGQYVMVTERFGQTDNIPKNKGKTVKWRRYNSLARASAPLSEGVTPASQKMTATDVTATMEHYGDLVEISDAIADTHEDNVLQAMIDVQGENAGETIEEMRINALKAGSNVYLANAVAARTNVNSPPLRGDFKRIIRDLKRNKARTISQIISATALVATEPVAPAYFAMLHTDLESDLEAMSGFTPGEKYSDSTKLLPGEHGKLGGMRFVLSGMIDPWLAAGQAGTTYLSGGDIVSGATACDVYPVICVGRDAYGITRLQGSAAVTPMVINPGKPSKSDPLAQRGFVSWKTMQACEILNQLWLARLECACTAKPI